MGLRSLHRSTQCAQWHQWHQWHQPVVPVSFLFSPSPTVYCVLSLHAPRSWLVTSKLSASARPLAPFETCLIRAACRPINAYDIRTYMRYLSTLLAS